MKEILKEAQKIKDDLVKIRREIHMNPEIGFEEFETSKLVVKELKELGIKVTPNVAETGVIGLIKGAKNNGKTIGIRADMDALSMQEENNVPYKSKVDGKMHACGHDAHTAILIGVAKLLIKMKDQLKGNVKLFFQPAEETKGGAKPMVKEGALKNPDVSAVISLHVDDRIDVGKLALKDGSLTASADEFRITITGKGGHAAYPHETIDPILVGSHLVAALQTIASRRTRPVYPVVVTVGTFHSGSIYNVIPETAYLTGTIRALLPEVRKQTHEHIKQIIKGIEKTFEAKIELEIIHGYSPGINDSELNLIIQNSAEELLGKESILFEEYPSMGAEDFFEFSDNYRIPVSMFWLGVRNEEKGIIHPGHNPKFDIDEDALPIGSAILALSAINYLNK